MMNQLKLIAHLRGLIILVLVLMFSGNICADEVTLNPSGFSTDMSNMSVLNPGNMTDASSTNTNYATLNVNKNSTGYAYITFDCSSIPDKATITSVTCTLKGAVNNTSRITAASVVAYVGTEVISNTSKSIRDANALTVTLLNKYDKLTRSNLDNFSIRINGTAGDYNNPKRIYIYGVDLTITYTTLTHAVTGINKSIKPGATTSPFTIATDYTGAITYSSANESIATVDANGVVTGIAEGSTTITATPAAQTGYDSNPVTITVRVTESHIPDAYIKNLTADNLRTGDATKSNSLYLYNKATGLYLSSGGHWGTEGLLKTTGLITWIDGTLSGNDLTSATMYSKYSSTKWGYVSSAQQINPDTHGLYLDAEVGHSFSFIHNDDDDSYSIIPNDVIDGIAIYYEDNGTKYYLYTSDDKALHWGTNPYYWTYKNNKIYSTSVSTPYYLYSSSNTLTISTTYSSAFTIDGSKLVIDGSSYLASDNSSFTVTSDATNICSATAYITDDNNKFYLAQNGGDSDRKNIVVTLEYPTNDIPDEARWFIISQDDIEKDYHTADATDAQPKEATYKLNDPDFARNVEIGWTFEMPSGTAYTNKTWTDNGYIRIGNSLFNQGGPNASVVSTGNVIETATGVDITTTTTYDADGKDYTVTNDDATYTNVPVGKTTYYNNIYGGYYSCRMLGKSGKIYQTITGLAPGNYKVSCDAYVYNPSGTTSNAVFYAKNPEATTTGAENVSTNLKENNTFETQTQAGITLVNESATYRNSLIVRVAENGKLELGVELSNGTLSTNGANKSPENTIVVLDGFKLEYTGNPEYYIILDEERSGSETFGDNKLNYINAQVYDVEGKRARTMYLKRNIKANQWNSFVLPVNINAGSLKTAFGDDVKLSEFNKCEGNRIYFKNIDLSDATATAMQAGTCYLIKPSSSNGQTSGTFSTKLAQATSNEISVTATENSPVYTFNQVTLSKEVDVEPGRSIEFKPTGHYSDAGNDPGYNYPLVFMGTYFNTNGIVDYGSYVISATAIESLGVKAGDWVRYTGKDGATAKGFRCWIGQNTSEVIPTTAKYITYIIGEDGDEEVTAIDDVQICEPTSMEDNRVFNLNGQLVGKYNDLRNLPKGIYITNGHKYIIK